MNINLKAYNKKFKNTKTIPYTYSITHKKTGIHYYGSRYSRGCSPNDFFKTYFSSCKIIHDIIKKEGIKALIGKVRKIFNTPEECIQHESKFLKRVDAKNNCKFFNRQNETIFVHCNFNFITNGSITLKWPKEKQVPEGYKIGVNRQINHNKGTRWIFNPKTKESRMIHKEVKLPRGFVEGRDPAIYKKHSVILKNKNTIHITDGEQTRQINKNESIPEGWRRGRVFKKPINFGKRKQKYIWITNSKENKQIPKTESIPKGWYHGRCIVYEKFKGSSARKIQYNNKVYDTIKSALQEHKCSYKALFKRGAKYLV